MDLYICCHTLQLQALVYNILPPSTAIIGGSLGAEKRGLECAIHGPINYMYMSMLPYTPTPGSGLRHPSIHGHDWRKLGAGKRGLECATHSNSKPHFSGTLPVEVRCEWSLMSSTNQKQGSPNWANIPRKC